MRALLLLSATAATLSVTGLAAAQQPAPPSCPPGSWFCEEAHPAPGQALPPLPTGVTDPRPPQTAPPPPPRYVPPPPVVYQQRPYGQPQYAPPPPYGRPPVVIYQPPPPVILVRPEAPPPYYYYRRPALVQPRSEWGLNLHAEGALIGGGSSRAGMGGVGFGLRYKPTPHFGVEADLDFVGGRDYNDYARTEEAFTFNGLFFLNPKSRAQIYLLAGLGWSSAQATDDHSFNQRDYSYSYFGGQAGVGLELRMSRHFALNADLRGFVRGRIDSNASAQPEFVDPATGRTTNTSGGGLITAGMTFYF